MPQPEHNQAMTHLAETLQNAYAEATWLLQEQGPVPVTTHAESGSVTIRAATWSVTFHEGLEGPTDVVLPGGQSDVTTVLTADDIEPLAVADAQLSGGIIAALVRTGTPSALSLADAIEYIQAKAPRRHPHA